ncbi:MAG: hypothetical protein ACRD43_00025, partial [Pyrinomonadaceae bacterium]
MNRGRRSSNKKTPKNSLGLPPCVVRQGSDKAWHVKRIFPTTERDPRGRIVYAQVKRRCFPETRERAEEIYE